MHFLHAGPQADTYRIFAKSDYEIRLGGARSEMTRTAGDSGVESGSDSTVVA